MISSTKNETYSNKSAMVLVQHENLPLIKNQKYYPPVNTSSKSLNIEMGI